MATVARSLVRAGSGFLKPVVSRHRIISIPRPSLIQAAPFHHTRPAFAEKEKDNKENAPLFEIPDFSPDVLTAEERAEYEQMTPEQRSAFDAEMANAVTVMRESDETTGAVRAMGRDLFQLRKESDVPTSIPRLRPSGFWAEDEEDEWAQAKDGDDHFNDDDITSMAHTDLDQHRDLRHYARVIAWEMPLLSNHAKPFQLPTKKQILRFRTTSYLGDSHPSEPKVVIEFCSHDLVPTHLTEPQRLTLLKLVGPRYNPDTDIVRMSCERFDNSSDNRTYLTQLVSRLVHEARTGDAFADIPLDTRHHKPKRRLRFPDEWILTPERKAALDAERAEAARAAQGRPLLVDGEEVVREAVRRSPQMNARAPAAEPVRVQPPRGRGRR